MPKAPPLGELARERLRGRAIPLYFAFLHIFTTFLW